MNVVGSREKMLCMRECKEHEITVERLLNVVHRSTERIKIRVVSDIQIFEDRVRLDYITTNFSKDKEEIERVLKYYKDVPCWNIHIETDNEYSYENKGCLVVSSIVANVHYSDIREGYLAEKIDLKKEKARAYRKRKKSGADVK